MKVSEFVTLPLELRKDHLNLSFPCEIIGGVSNVTRQRRARKKLLTLLQLDDDVKNWKTFGVRTCHGCHNDSQSSEVCSNPLHLYVGSALENYSDIPISTQLKTIENACLIFGGSGGRIGGPNSYNMKVGLHNQKRRKKEKWNEKGGRSMSSQFWISTYDGFGSSPGCVANHNKALGISKDNRVKVPSTAETEIKGVPQPMRFLWLQQYSLEAAILSQG